MKKYVDTSETISRALPDLIHDKTFEELEITKRTQIPPSEALIEKLNHLASKPPFCYTHKPKKHDTR